MSEWWTYSLSSFLLFSPATYYRLFELYNAALWPAHLPVLAAGATILLLMSGGEAWRGRIVAAMLAAGWLWIAWGFLLTRYSTINWAALYLAAAFALQAALLALLGVLAGKLRFGGPGFRPGIALFVFALAVQPLIGPLIGRAWSQVEIFGLAPDPTAVATLGILAACRGRARYILLVVPVAWCVVGGATLWAMEAPDAALPYAAAALGLAFAARRGGRAPPFTQAREGREARP